ncbi:hypothetical protein HRbin08_00844 [bacterium HR08]|nr:hypothetical protein HRbin08_00844 [bacterium HR08]
MRRSRIAIIVALASGAILAIALGLALWAKSEYFDRFLERMLADRLKPLHVRVEFRDANISLRRRTVEVTDLRLFPDSHADPLLRVPHLSVRVSIEDLFARAFSIADLRLDRPQILITVDASGHPNFADINWSALRRPKEPKPYTLRVERVMITEGRILVNDRKHRFHLEAEGVTLSFAPTPSEPRALGGIERLDLTWDERMIARARVEWRAAIFDDHVRLERVRMASDVGEALLAGTIRGWTDPQYDLVLTAFVHLDRVAANGPSPLAFSGDVALRGRMHGRGRVYQLEATATAARATMWGIRMTGASWNVRTPEAAPTRDSSGARLAFQMTAEALVAAFFRARGIAVLGTLPASTALVFEGAIGGRAALLGPLPLEGIRARLRVEPEQAFIEDLDLHALWGRVRGYARVRFAGGSREENHHEPLSEAHLRFEDVDVRDVAMRFLHRPLPLEGLAQGSLTARWPGLAITRASGVLALKVAPRSVPMAEALPVRGALDATVSPRGLSMTASSLIIGRSKAMLSGRVSWRGDLDLVFDVRSDDMSEQQRLLEAYGYRLRALTHDLIPQLAGTADYRLHLIRRDGTSVVSGEGELKGLLLAGEPVRSLRARFAYAHGRWEIEDAHVLWETGARAEVRLTALPDQENGLALRGRLHRVSLDRWSKALGLELPFSGVLSGEIALSGLPQTPTGTARIALEEGEVLLLERPARFRRLAGTFHLAPPRYEVQDARLDLSFGTITLSGFFRTDDGTYALRMRAEDIELASLLGATMGRTMNVQGRVALSLSGQGTLSDPRFSGEMRISRLSIGGRPAGEITAELKTSEGRLLIPITAALFGQTHALLGTLDLTDPAPMVRVRARFEDLSLTPYLRLVRRLSEWSGTMSGEVQLQWPIGARLDPTGSRRREEAAAGVRATLALSNLRLAFNEYALHARRPFTLHLHGRRLMIESAALVGENTSLDLSGTVDLSEFLGERLGDGHDLNVNGSVDLRLLRGLYPGLFAAGRATIRASLRGYFEEPRLSGLMEIEDLSLRVLDWPISLAHGRGRIRFTASQALIEHLRAQANEGDVTISGGLLLRRLRADQWRILIRSDAVALAYPPGLRSIVDGMLTLQGNRQVQVLSGTLTVRRSEYTQDVDLAQLILAQAGERRRPSLPEVALHPPISLDIRVTALDTLMVRNNLADVVGSASLHIGGTLAAPRLSGNLIVTRGVVRFRNREYQITRGRLDFPREEAAQSAPRIHLEAESDIAGYRVIVGFTGTLDRFQTTLRSEPALPPEQILALIATGEISQRAALTTPQTGLGTAANLLIGELTHRAEEFTGKIFGINRFQIDPLIVGRGSDPTARLTIGRQITRNLSILYATNLSGPQEQVIIVEYRLSDRFSLVGARDQDGNFSFDLRIRKRF